MKVPSPAAMIGAVETTKSTEGRSTSREEGRASRARRRSDPASARPRSTAPRRTPRRSIAVKTASRSWGATAKHGIPISSRARTLSRGFPSVVHRTRSGDRATIRSTSGSLTPPIFGRREAAGGTLQYRVTPTRDPSRPRRKTISVRLGARETMRRGGAASRTTTPRSSFNARGNRSAACAGRAFPDARRRTGRNPARRKRAAAIRTRPDMEHPPARCPAENRLGEGKTARPDGESAPALLPRKASRDLSPPGRSPGFRLPGGPQGVPPPYSPRLPARALVSRAVAPLRISSPVTVAGQRWTCTIFPCPGGNVPICDFILPPGAPCVKAESVGRSAGTGRDVVGQGDQCGPGERVGKAVEVPLPAADELLRPGGGVPDPVVAGDQVGEEGDLAVAGLLPREDAPRPLAVRGSRLS